MVVSFRSSLSADGGGGGASAGAPDAAAVGEESVRGMTGERAESDDVMVVDTRMVSTLLSCRQVDTFFRASTPWMRNCLRKSPLPVSSLYVSTSVVARLNVQISVYFTVKREF